MAEAVGSFKSTVTGAKRINTIRVDGFRPRGFSIPANTYSSLKLISAQDWQCGITAKNATNVVGGLGQPGANCAFSHMGDLAPRQ